MNPIETMLDAIDWKKVEYPEQEDSHLPFVTHEGDLHLPGITLKVLMLSSFQRVIPESEMKKFFDWLGAS